MDQGTTPDHQRAQAQMSQEIGQTEHITQFFTFDHLPGHLSEVSKPFAVLARFILDTLPRNPERQG